MELVDALANGAITVVNGVLSILGILASPITLLVVALGASFAWLALLERDELDRQGTKPGVGRGH